MGFSLKWLLAAVTLTAIGLTALFNASAAWVAVVSLATTTVLLTALLGAIYCRERGRALAVGWCIFGWGYLLLAYAPQPYNRIAAYGGALDYLGDTLQRTEPMERDLSGLAQVERDFLLSHPGLNRTYTVHPEHVEGVAKFLLAWIFAAVGGIAGSYFYAGRER